MAGESKKLISDINLLCSVTFASLPPEFTVKPWLEITPRLYLCGK
jgi:hypothetical protein